MKLQGLIILTCTILLLSGCNNPKLVIVPEAEMQRIYEEVKTPFKYGLVMVPPDDSKKMDCPSIFRKDGKWMMTYIVFDGRGYETWMAESNDLLHWNNKGCIMSFSNDTTRWDWNQKAGYIALQDYKWGGSYEMEPFDGRYWMSYIGGRIKGYESGVLSVGIAYTEQNPATVHEWKYLDKPVIAPTDKDVRWWENSTQYKSTVIHDKEYLTGHPFVMYYNARGDSINPGRGAERIGMAVSDDMITWERFMRDPVINHHKGISGDAYIQKIGDIYVQRTFQRL
jgi:hypothetical protein